MKYKIRYSKSKEFQVYQKFTYPSRIRHGTRGFLSIVFLSIGVLILLPTPDEILIHSAGLLSFSKALNISIQQALFISASLYKSVGLLFLVLALVFGGRHIKEKLRNKMIAAGFKKQ